jgi:hypothetical protein
MGICVNLVPNSSKLVLSNQIESHEEDQMRQGRAGAGLFCLQ